MGKLLLVLVDGVSYNDPHNGGLDLSNISAENIKKVEIIKGPASVIYGANAMGGVINIITKDIGLDPETKVSASYGSYNNLIYSLSHSERIGDLGIRISYKDKNSDGLVDGEKLDQEIFHTKLKYDLNNYSDLTFSFENNDSKKSHFGFGAINDQDDFLQNLQLKWTQEKENYKTTVDVYNNYQERIYPSDNSKHEKYQRGINFNNTNFFENHTLNYGLEFKENEVKSTNLIDNEKTNLNKALFIKDNWNYNQKLDFIFAARYDDHEEYGSNLSPQIAVNYKLNNNYITYLSYAEAFKAPTFDDLYGYYPSIYGDYLGNQDLEPEESKNYEIGLKFEKERYQGSIAYFERNVNNLINSYYYDTIKGINTAKNIEGTSEIQGIELDLESSLTEKLISNLNYTYLDARNNDGERIDYNPYHNAKLKLAYNLTEKSNISLSGNLLAGRKDRPSHFVLDTGIKLPLNIKEQNFNVNFSINNILDKEYEVADGYPMPGRNFMLNLSTKF